MYAIIHKNKVIIGPKDWSPSFFEFQFRRLNIEHKPLPRKAPQELPYSINDDTKVLSAKVITDEFTNMVQYLRGPIWSIEDDVAVAHYQVVDTPIEFARNNFRELAATERYKKEVAGVRVTIQDTEVTCDTSREGRNIYVQKLSLMNDDDTVNWKFPEGWLNLTKSDLSAIVTAGATHIQSAFDWEKGINDRIDSSETADDLLAIEIVEKVGLNGLA